MSKSEWRKNDEAIMSNDETTAAGPRYDLEDRTARFGEAIIRFAKGIPVNPVTEPLIRHSTFSTRMAARDPSLT